MAYFLNIRKQIIIIIQFVIKKIDKKLENRFKRISHESCIEERMRREEEEFIQEKLPIEVKPSKKRKNDELSNRIQPKRNVKKIKL